MKFKTVILSAALIGAGTMLFANYQTGFKYYKKYIKKATDLKSTEFIKKLGIKNEEDVENYFKDNGKLLLEKVKKMSPKAAEKIEKIIKKGKLDDLKDFFKGLVNGKIPAGC